MASIYSPNIITNGLVLALDAANIKSYPGTGSTWASIPNSYSANLINTPTVSGGYVSFDGVNEYASFTSEASFSTGNGVNYSFELWFKMRTLPTAQYGANSHIWGGENGNDVVIYLNPVAGGVSKGIMVYDDTRYNGSMMTTGGFTADTWAHWVITGNGTTNTVTHYINGGLDRGPTGVSPTSQYVRPWGGTRFAYDSRWVVYSTLDLAVAKQYNRELSAAEVLQNYNATKGRFGL